MKKSGSGFVVFAGLFIQSKAGSWRVEENECKKTNKQTRRNMCAELPTLLFTAKESLWRNREPDQQRSRTIPLGFTAGVEKKNAATGIKGDINLRE